MSLLGDQGNAGGNTNAGQTGDTGGQGASGGAGGSSNGGDSGGSWRNFLPADLREDVTLKNFSDVGSLAKSYIHAQQQIGKKGVIPPTDKSTDEEWSAFYKQLGQPELDKFEVKYPEGVKVDEAGSKQFKEAVHKLGLLPKQAQGLLDWHLKTQGEAAQAAAAKQKLEFENHVADLKREWGEGYRKNIMLADQGAKMVDPDFRQYLDDSGLSNNPKVVRFLAKVGKMFGEDKLLGDGAGKFGRTPAELDFEIQKLEGSAEYLDPSHPSHRNILAQRDALYQKRYA